MEGSGSLGFDLGLEVGLPSIESSLVSFSSTSNYLEKEFLGLTVPTPSSLRSVTPHNPGRLLNIPQKLNSY